MGRDGDLGAQGGRGQGVCGVLEAEAPGARVLWRRRQWRAEKGSRGSGVAATPTPGRVGRKLSVRGLWELDTTVHDERTGHSRGVGIGIGRRGPWVASWGG